MPSIYLLEPTEAEYDNEYGSFAYEKPSIAIVRAFSGQNARKLVSRSRPWWQSIDEAYAKIWLDENRVRVRRLAETSAKGEEVISLGWPPLDP